MGTDKPRRLSPGFAHAFLLCVLAAPAAGFARPGLPAARQECAASMLATADDTALVSIPAAGSSPVDFSKPLMAAVSGDGYDTLMAFVIGFGLHACVPFGSLNGVLNDAAWGASLHLTPEQVVSGDSAVFLAWIPGGLVGGPLSDAVGRKRASLGCAVFIALALVATACVAPDDAGGLIASRALAGLGIGGFMAAAPTMLLESADVDSKGRAALAWSVGYVTGLSLLAAVHTGLLGAAAAGAAGGGLGGLEGIISGGWEAWRVEQLLAAGWVLAFVGVTQALVAEPPTFLLAGGDVPAALGSARRICGWNGIDLDEALATPPLARLAEAGIYTAAEAAEECLVDPSEREAEAEGEGRAPAAALCAPAEPGLLELLAPSGLLRTSITLALFHLAFNLAFYQLIFSLNTIEASTLSFVLLALADLPGSALSAASCDAVGARTTAARFQGGAGALLLLLAVVSQLPPAVGAEWRGPTETGLSLAAKTGCAGAYTALTLLTTQAYPPKLRSSGLGLGMMVGKAGAASAPPLSALLPHAVSLQLVGVLSLAAAAATLTLPVPGVAAGGDEADSEPR